MGLFNAKRKRVKISVDALQREIDNIIYIRKATKEAVVDLEDLEISIDKAINYKEGDADESN